MKARVGSGAAWQPRNRAAVLRLALLALLVLLAPLSARAVVMLDDFGTAQASGTTVAGSMLFGHRSLASFAGTASVAGGVFSYVQGAGNGTTLRYAPPFGEPLQPLDFSLVSRIHLDVGTAAVVPSIVLRLYSGSNSDYAQAGLPAISFTGEARTVLSVGLEDLLSGQRGNFDLTRVTGLSLIFGPLVFGEGPMTIDSMWVSGTLAPVPEPAGLVLMTGGLALLLWRRHYPARPAAARSRASAGKAEPSSARAARWKAARASARCPAAARQRASQ